MVQTRSTTDSRTRNRKREILRAASRIFRARGFHETGMRDIAGAMGVAVGQLYYYFQSKQDLLAFCQEDSLESLLRMAAAVGEVELPADQRLWLQIAGHVRCLNEGTPGSLAHLEVDRLDPEVRARIVALRDRYEATFSELVAEGIEVGLFRDVDVKLATLAILGAVNWTARWYRQDGRVPIAQVAGDFATHLVQGLLAEGTPLTLPDHPVPQSEDAAGASHES